MLCANTVSFLVKGMTIADDGSISMECLEVINEILIYFGQLLEEKVHESIASTVIQLLRHANNNVRKRASKCVGVLSSCLSEEKLNELFNQLLTVSSETDVATVVQAIASVGQNIGCRIGGRLNDFIPYILKHLGDHNDEDTFSDKNDTLRESCFDACASFLSCSSRDLRDHIPKILNACTNFISYDPNFMEDSSDSESEDISDADDEYSDDNDALSIDVEYEDADDTSWKVRKASINVLSVLMLNHFDALALGDLLKIFSVLIQRIREREENVRLCVLSCICVMITRGPNRNSSSALELEASRETVLSLNETAFLKVVVEDYSSDIFSQSVYQLSKNGAKTQIAIYNFLAKYFYLMSHCITENSSNKIKESTQSIEQITQYSLKSLKCNGDPTLVCSCLRLLQSLLLQGKNYSVNSLLLQRSASSITELLALQSNEIVAQALSTAFTWIRKIRPVHDGKLLDCILKESSVIFKLYNAILPKLQVHDIDQQVKDAAIKTISEMFAKLGDILGDHVEKILALLYEKMLNEVTRLSALKAFINLLQTQLNLDITSILNPLLESLSGFLRQQSRTLKIATIKALQSLLKSYQKVFLDQIPHIFSDDFSHLVCDQDLNLSHLIIQLVCEIVSKKNNSSIPFLDQFFKKTLTLSRSPLLQGQIIYTLGDFFTALVSVGFGVGTNLTERLMNFESGKAGISKQIVDNLSICIAQICTSFSQLRDEMLNRLLSDIKNLSTARRCLLIASIGYIGKKSNLSQHKTLIPCIRSQFDSSEEIVRSTASKALGRIISGSLSAYGSEVKHMLQETQSKYLVIAAILELILCQEKPSLEFSKFVEDVKEELFMFSIDTSGSIGKIASECLGRMGLLEHSLIKTFIDKLKSKSALVRASMMHAIKFCVSSQTYDIISPFIPQCFSSLSDDDLRVNEEALVTLNAIAHHNPTFLHGVFFPHQENGNPNSTVKTSLWPALFSHMIVKKELKRSVNLGPFKQRVDDGLVLRKLAFTCVSTMLQTMTNTIDVAAFVPHLAEGLGEKNEDINMLCHQILIQICGKFPEHVLLNLEEIINPIKKKLSKVKMKGTSVNLESQRAEQFLISCLRVIITIRKLNVGKSPFFVEVIKVINSNATCKLLYEQLIQEQN